ncbi:adenosylcobinamide-GDP ribazoletransferase [Labedaea rhizosphaerae]|uniref:Adenosylcobinamide-GDP ribazoletransferase n=1 Tax=Labedaea rhizosphaerae TaxID=598644 RepID=A0A4V3CZ00_LABRH|nr:adenosylcobinamide-GDP ribazoletransferase [Labedaea rhizosphaerae]TDP96118.1 cobalamin-5'-phosphate synthase [Labedaea rhizosphaerae]
MRLALSWLTILPVRGPAAVDRAMAGRAIALAPVVGLLLGGVAVGVLFGLSALGAPGLIAGFVTVGVLALATRGMHLDGLADTADGLGCYGPPERALAVMKDGGAGPFAMVTLIVVLGAQAAAFGALVPDRWPSVLCGLVAGRAAFAVCCAHGVPAARPDGLGALVAGTQHPVVAVLWWLTVAIGAGFAVPDKPWVGPVAVAVAAAVVVVIVRHTRRRFGGITGDVLGACAEAATTIVLCGCTLF